MKKRLVSVLSIIFIIFLSACNSTESSSSSEEKEIVLGATVPYSDMLEKGVKPLLEKKGYKVEVKEFNDYVQPNLSLGSGSLDGNLFQHKVYMEAFAKEHNLELSEVITVPTAPIGIYSEKFKTLDEISEGSTVAIANDPTNLARHLKVLNDAGVITFSESADPLRATVKDIKENPKKLKFKEIEAAQLPRTLGSVDVVAINGNFAIAAGIDLTSALAVDKLPADFLNRIIVRTEDLDKQFVKDIKEAVESKEFRKVIDTDFKGFTKPEWLNQ
jgi:D-methionine transport system substrate-binding protein